jgi:hypothetical protein
VKDPLVDLWLTKRFKVKGDARLVALYRLRMSVERSFRAGKLELEIITSMVNSLKEKW